MTIHTHKKISPLCRLSLHLTMHVMNRIHAVNEVSPTGIAVIGTARSGTDHNSQQYCHSQDCHCSDIRTVEVVMCCREDCNLYMNCKRDTLHAHNKEIVMCVLLHDKFRPHALFPKLQSGRCEYRLFKNCSMQFLFLKKQNRHVHQIAAAELEYTRVYVYPFPFCDHPYSVSEEHDQIMGMQSSIELTVSESMIPLSI